MTAEARPRECVVADDHPALLHTIRDLVLRHGFEHVSEASDAPTALQTIAETRPALGLLDYRMAGLTGEELIARAHDASPETAIVVYTAEADADLARSVLELGATGLVLKESPLPDLVRAIDAVLAGSLYVDSGVGAVLSQSTHGQSALTQRETEVLDFLTQGLSHGEIADRLDLSSDTVRTHLRKAILRLKARNRTHAVATAIRLGLLD